MDHDTGKSFKLNAEDMSAYIYRIDEGLQFCIKAIQDFAYSGFGGRGGKHGDKAPLVSCQRCFGGLRLIAYLMLAHRVSSRSAELKQGLALRSLTHLLPRILVGYGAFLELLAAEGDLLEVLLAVCPILLVVYTVATCTFQLLHG